jgi:hypothetical protein
MRDEGEGGAGSERRWVSEKPCVKAGGYVVEDGEAGVVVEVKRTVR